MRNTNEHCKWLELQVKGKGLQGTVVRKLEETCYIRMQRCILTAPWRHDVLNLSRIVLLFYDLFAKSICIPLNFNYKKEIPV